MPCQHLGLEGKQWEGVEGVRRGEGMGIWIGIKSNKLILIIITIKRISSQKG